MNKHTSFAMVILLFLFLTFLVIFGFFIIFPEIKAYRSQAIVLEQKKVDLAQKEAAYEKMYKDLQLLKEREAGFDQALNRGFKLEAFEAYLQHYFLSFEIQSIISEQDAHLQTDILEIRAIFDAPTTYYRFIDALNDFEWVAEVEGTQEFKGVAVGIEAHFVLKVYTQK